MANPPTARKDADKATAKTKWVSGTDGSGRIAVPSSWAKMQLNDDAAIEVGNGDREQYLIVISDNKADLDEDLNHFARETVGAIASGLSSKKISAPRHLQVGGRPSVQYEVRGVADNVNIVYWHTSVEGTDHYFQVIAWTVASHAAENGPKLRSVVMTFRENVK